MVGLVMGTLTTLLYGVPITIALIQAVTKGP